MSTYLYFALIMDIVWTVVGGITIWWGIKYSSIFWLVIGIVCILVSVISIGYIILKQKTPG